MVFTDVTASMNQPRCRRSTLTHALNPHWFFSGHLQVSV
ncbi:hypothetical protein MC7420_7072 [Coleofasciculus chthonoplastes PCC 7420]|uniref:Uncharacterized protein n=1 Tax=Coleofasciculus chthonoplastes PCC 7420 TaxID=118168 RepID=B4VI23_9CYAN|nr:hypothetical protein MC7420_7072 [Coleofasciculus chthonoplastes PCC 7420]